MFRHGVASGDPRPDGVVLWTRVEGAPSRFIWEIATDPAVTGVVAGGYLPPPAADTDWTVHVDVGGLDPATTYWYRFFWPDGPSSPIGRTRTLPGPDATNVRFAMVSCAKYNAGFFNAYARIAERDDLDFVLHLGDYIYEAAQAPPPSQTPAADIGREVDPLHECKTLEDYRRRYARYRLDPDVAALHLAHPLIATVDDHEFADGTWRDGSVEHHPDRDGPFARRRATAWRAHWEWLPFRPPDPADAETVYRTVPIGTLADLLLIDIRTHRDEPSAAAIDDPRRGMLGPAQREWLLGELARSQARWRLLANPSPLAPTWSDTLPAFTRQPLATVKLIAPDGNGPDPDQWDGYVPERDAVIAALPPDTVVLAGDVHVSLAMEMPTAVEFVTASLTSQNVDDKMGWAPRTESLAIEAAYGEALPHVRWCELDSNGYVVVDVTPERVAAEWWHVDTVLRPSPHQTCAARWTVRHGTSRLTPG
ncbi:MAG: alkaline phosphatase D family protein [Acidimicrobiales bacterium]